MNQPARRKLEASRLRYDSSIAPELLWDESPARKEFEHLIAQVREAEDLDAARLAGRRLQELAGPPLNWAGKAESESLDVDALPLFVHEKLSTTELLETLMRKRRDKPRMLELFGEEERSLEDKVLGAYQHLNGWKNRLIFGDSMLVMNSLLRYESFGGSVQMVYMDPPYGVKFRGNFQPFVRKRKDSKDDDAALTREPEMIKAYRDTWSLGVHSWLTYMRSRLFLARSLLSDSGSCFVQISDENVHLARCVMDEIFGPENFCKMIFFRTTAGDTSHKLPNMGDYILWYAKEIENVKAEKIFAEKTIGRGAGRPYKFVESPDKSTVRELTDSEIINPALIPKDWRVFRIADLKRQGYSKTATFNYNFNGHDYHPGPAHQWKTNRAGLDKLKRIGWLHGTDETLSYKRYFDDFPVTELGNMWHDTGGARDKVYAVQTSEKVVQRCMLMTTDPGDLVLDPTCGSGTTAFVAEQWGRRWITCDTSRVPLALARQRLLTSTFAYYKLKDQKIGPRSGFVYIRNKAASGEEKGGIVPHVTLKSIVKETPAPTEVLLDRPEKEQGIVRVCGSFCVESVLSPSLSIHTNTKDENSHDDALARAKHIDRMLEVLRRSPSLRLPNKQSITLEHIAPLANALSLHAEAIAPPPPNVQTERVAIHIGPEHGAVSEISISESAKEAHDKGFGHLFVIGFAFDAFATTAVPRIEKSLNVKISCITALADLLMEDLLKNTRSSQVFAFCGIPDIEILPCKDRHESGEKMIRVKLRGLDVFDPATSTRQSLSGADVPMWMIDIDYDSACFCPAQVFFPRTKAWESLNKKLRNEIDISALKCLHSDTSTPFVPGRVLAVKTFDDRGNEFMAVRCLIQE